MDTDTLSRDALRRAVDHLGGQSALARAMGRRQSVISYWLYHAREIPAVAAIDIERATGGVVRRHEIRPDLFGKEGTWI